MTQTLQTSEVIDVPPGVMGRAGLMPAGQRIVSATPKAVSAGFHLPDLSEFNQADWPALVAANGGGAIIRALYGTNHIDFAWTAGRRAAAHSAGVQLLGIYQYLRKDQDAVAQARAFVGLVGRLQSNEFAILDHEEGDGSQLTRAIAWLATVGTQLPAYPGYTGSWLYSGLNFAETHGLSPIFANNQVHTWVAAYGNTEPSLGHSLWQHTNGQIGVCSHEPWSGSGFVDCSSRTGGLSDLKSLVTGGISQPGTQPGGENMSGQLKNGYGQQDLINFIGGSAGGIGFGCNAGEVGLNAPWVKVAIGLPDGTWSRSRIRIPADTTVNDGTVTVDFPNGGDGVKSVSVIRDSNGSADNVAVGWHLY